MIYTAISRNTGDKKNAENGIAMARLTFVTPRIVRHSVIGIRMTRLRVYGPSIMPSKFSRGAKGVLGAAVVSTAIWAAIIWAIIITP